MQDDDVVLFIAALAKTVTLGGSPPAVPGAARTAGHLKVLFSWKILAVRKGNDTYRPVVRSCYWFILIGKMHLLG